MSERRRSNVLCACGCGGYTMMHGKTPNRFIEDHHLRRASSLTRDTPLTKEEFAEKLLKVEAWIQGQTELSRAGEYRVARELGLTRPELKALIERAKFNFAAKAERYVEAHAESVEAGLKLGNAAGLRMAAEASQWAMEHMALDGARVVDPPVKVEDHGGPKILIGVQVGGINQQPTTIDVTTGEPVKR